MRRLMLLAAAVAAFVMVAVANAATPPNIYKQSPFCNFFLNSSQLAAPSALATPATVGFASFQIVNAKTGTVHYTVLAEGLKAQPSTLAIYWGALGTTGTLKLDLTPTLTGDTTGVIARGTFTNPALVAGMWGYPAHYYVQVDNVTYVGLTKIVTPMMRGQMDNLFGFYL
jgi:hypothetical protein